MKLPQLRVFLALLFAASLASAEAARADNHDVGGDSADAAHLDEGEQGNIGSAREIVIGGGSVSGVYFPAAGAICRVVSSANPGQRCLVESNANSSTNLERLTGGLLDFAVVQSDWLMHASKGTSLFRPSGPDENLRAVFSLHAEPLTLVARAGAQIRKPADMEDKRINLGPAHTYQRVLIEALLRAIDLDEDDFAQVREISAAEQFTALCAGELDAAAIVAAHPSSVLADAMQRCELQLVPIAGDEIEALLERRPELAPATIPGGLYAGAPDDVPTFGLRAVLATTTQVEATMVRAVVEAVLGSLPELTKQHPVLAELQPESMASAGIALPLHAEAERVLKTMGVIP